MCEENVYAEIYKLQPSTYNSTIILLWKKTICEEHVYENEQVSPKSLLNESPEVISFL